MHDLLSKYLTGDISSEEKQTLFLLLKENTELKKEAADIQNLSALVSMVREEHPASDMQYRSFVHLRGKRTFLFNMRKIAGYAAIMVILCFVNLFINDKYGRKRRRTCPLPGVFNPARSACQGIAGRQVRKFG